MSGFIERLVTASLAASLAAISLLPANAVAGISEISAHGQKFSASAVIPVFVDSSVRTKIVLKGQFMDLATGVSATDSRYSVSIGRRIMGGNSSIEILVGVGDSVPDGDESTVKVHFVAGEERFKVKTFKSRIDRLEISPPRANNTFKAGESVIVLAHGVGLDNVDAKGAVSTMLRAAAGNIYSVEGPLPPGSTATRAAFSIELKAKGAFSVTKDWFRDARHTSPVGETLVRGNPSSVRITVEPPPAIQRRPVS